MPAKLYFNGDTYITLPIMADITDDYTLEYTFKLGSFSDPSRKYIHSIDLGENSQGGAVELIGGSKKIREYRPFLLGTIDYAFLVDTEYTVQEIYTVGTPNNLEIKVNTISIGNITGGIVSDNPHQFDEFTSSIGRSLFEATNAFTGIIDNFKIYDDLGVLIHHWPIDDNVPDTGEITDIVGGAHGILTLGTGYWILPGRIKITGFKKQFPTILSYNGASVALTPNDDSNTLAVKLQALLAADPVIGGIVGDLSVTTPATCDLHYTFEVTFSLLDTAAIPSSAENRDGTSVFTEDSLVSTLITNGMAHIEGIASGRSRLIAWDEDDIVYNSSSSDFTDFTPSAETGANQMTISSLKGRIIKCEGFTQGFVIYGTGNVVIATFNKSATSMYSFKPVGESEGLIDFRHLGPAKDAHYYWSSKGLAILDPEGKKFEFLAPELTDWIKKHRYPISIKLLSNRFLVIYIQDRNIAFSNRSVRNGGRAILAGKAHPSLTPVEFEYIAPGPNLYPTYQRAFLFDTQLGKWGSCDEPCKLLVSLTPYNQSGYQLSKNYQLMDASLDNEQKELTIRLADGYTYVANTFPTDSYILFGHYATHRDRFTKLVAIDTEYVDYPDATLEVEKSVDGAKVDFTQNVSYAQTTLAPIQGFNLAAKWFNILVKGHYHLKRLLVKGYTYGRRP